MAGTEKGHTRQLEEGLGFNGLGEEQAQEPQGQQQGAGWLELSDIDRITMEAASPSGPKSISDRELDKSIGFRV
ncbi:hypothetical protein GUITHDRAFT_102627 [Guillardia theta CCMP2712]|uniref:Uncharacterized protein n=1 Tax=Guillardia theta (strain CCMP2712) TaxID=905079 RepID=L1JV90_GUITC|nr:hypothetical protein GUITHDRAFT_102627 [Guillardia theta CCMP2712]EKX52013.1 hypothetical protein GUITHDRAFT_102627 [Guillardia theta CCMP2712]|eukprot:XP_005838993.1 hypothetical protein GUITHDRAFT_102627 [Guillardia theta CCMP2712]